MSRSGLSSPLGRLRRITIATVAAVALVVGVAVPAGAIPAPEEPVAAEPNTGLVATDVPPLSSPKAFTPGSATLAPEVTGTPDASVAGVVLDVPAGTAKSDPATSELTGRDEYTDYFIDGAGQRWAQLSPEPKNVKDFLGRWVPLSEQVEVRADGSAKAPLHPLVPEFADDSAGRVLSVARNGFEVSLELEGAEANSAKCADVGAGQIVCAGATSNPGGGGTTFGNAFVTQKSFADIEEAPKGLLEHEWAHSVQWASLGGNPLLMGPAYGLSAWFSFIFTHDYACGNAFEALADFGNGGYTSC